MIKEYGSHPTIVKSGSYTERVEWTGRWSLDLRYVTSASVLQMRDIPLCMQGSLEIVGTMVTLLGWPHAIMIDGDYEEVVADWRAALTKVG